MQLPIRFTPLAACATGLVACIVAWTLAPSAGVEVAAVVFAVLTLVGVRDLRQTRHAILRNYPVIGHLRFLLEFIRPEMRQYFIESDTEAAPFSRAQRSLVYQRAKGAPERQVLTAHVLRNALLPVVTMLGMDIGISLGGAIFTETVFQLPGLGQTAIIGISNQDLAIVQGVIVFATLAIIVFNLLVDLLYAWIDPRIRLT